MREQAWKLGGVNRDPETAGDGLVGSAFSEKLKDLQFPRRQPCVGVYCSGVLWRDQPDIGLLATGGQPHTGNVRKQGGQSLRKIGVVDLDRNHEWFGGGDIGHSHPDKRHGPKDCTRRHAERQFDEEGGVENPPSQKV